MQKILLPLLAVWYVVSRPFRKIYTANICGHRTNQTGKVTSFAESYAMSMPLSENGNPDYCLDCIAKMAIKCAWCANPIFIGDPVSLATPNEESDKVPPHAVRYDEDGQYLVGCIGWNCIATGIDRCGFWMPPGRVSRVPSPLEILLSNGNKGKALIIHDLSNPNDLGKII